MSRPIDLNNGNVKTGDSYMSRNSRDLGFRNILSVALCVAAAACGGGEGDSSSSAPTSRARMNILEFTDIKLPIGLADRSYETKVEVVGGTPPFRFSIVEGQLPEGLDLDAEQGVIAGRPARKGSFAIKLLVRDSTGVEARREFELLIDETAGGAEESQQHFKAQGATHESRQSTVTVSDLTSLQAIVSSMPEGSWQRVNLNNYSAAWTPSDLRPLFGGGVLPPSKIILAWSSSPGTRTAETYSSMEEDTLTIGGMTPIFGAAAPRGGSVAHCPAR